MKIFFYSNRILLVILIASFLASLAYSFYFRIPPSVDARAYDTIALNIISGAGYREDLSRSLKADPAITRVGPLYEYFLAGIYKVFGHHYEAVWIIQAILRALTAWLLYLTALLIFAASESGKKIGLWAAGIIGFYPDLIEISAMLMTETLYLFLFVLLIYAFLKFIFKPARRQAAIFGLITGLAVLARPPVLFLIPVLLFYFWRKKLWRQAFLFLIVLTIVFTPWSIRNYKTYGQFMPFGNGGAFNFWIGNYPGASGEQGLTEEQQEYLSGHDAVGVNNESIRRFKNFIFVNPWEFIKLTLLRINKYFSVIRPMGFWFYQHGLGQLLVVMSSALAWVFLFTFSLAGIFKAIREKDKRLYYVLALAVFTPLILFVTVVETRYRLQIYPLLAIFAGYYLAQRQIKWCSDKIFWAAVALILGNGIIDLLLSMDKFKERLGGFF